MVWNRQALFAGGWRVKGSTARSIAFAAGVVIALLFADTALAQSKAKAPVLDVPLKQFIGAMTPLTGHPARALDGQIIVITFFASWCPPCRPEFGHLNEVRQAFPEDDVAILAINLFEDFFRKGKAQRMARFLNATRPDFPVLRADDDAAVETRFGGVDRIPTVYIFDRQGKPAYTFIHQDGAEKTHATAVELTAALRKIIE